MDLPLLAALPIAAYATVAILVALDALMPAIPGEVALVSAGALSATGHLHAAWVVLAAVVGAFAGDYLVYSVGRRRLPAVLERSRLGRRLAQGIERAYARVGSASVAAIIGGRFVPLGRTASSAAAGLAGVPRRTFVLAALVGGTAWSIWMVGIGHVTGTMTEAPLWLQSAIGVSVAVLVGVWIAAANTIIRTRRRMNDYTASPPAVDTHADGDPSANPRPTPSPHAVIKRREATLNG